MFIRRIHLQVVQQVIPVGAQGIKGGVSLGRVQVAGDDRLDRALVDRLRARRVKLIVAGVFVVAQHEGQAAAFARFQRQLDMVGADGRPAVRDTVGGFTTFHHLGGLKATVRAQERFTLGIKPRQFFGTGKVSEVIAALAVLGLVVDHAIHHLDLTGAEVALEVGHVVLGIPQRELHKREQRQAGAFRASVGDGDLPDFERFVQRDKVAHFRANLVVAGTDGGVAHAVPAGVIGQRAAHRLPGG